MSDFNPPGTPANGTRETPPPAEVIAGRYRIERTIGEGAFGRVYLALDSRLRRNVAIKELLASLGQIDPVRFRHYVGRFQREARATGMIQQPNVVTVYDLHVDADGNHYLVMEYVDGVDLRQLLQAGALPAERAVAIALDVARALEAVHGQGIVHRAVQPANIMITRRGTTKLMDFGAARIGQEETSDGWPHGAIYLSPEQIRGFSPDRRSDLYGLGLVLYEMLTDEKYARTRQPLGAVRPKLPPPLLTIVDTLLAQNPDARYQHAEDVIRDLDNLQIITTPGLAADWAAGDAPTLPEGTRPSTSAAPPPAVGVPPAYGGPPTQPSGPPIDRSGSAPSDTVTAPTFPLYRPSPAVALPPTRTPPRRRNRGMLLGIGGALLTTLAVLAVVALAPKARSGGAATATPVQSATSTASPTATSAASQTATSTSAQTGAAPTVTAVRATLGVATSTGVAVSTPSPTPAVTATRAATGAPAPARTATPSGPLPLTTFTDPSGVIRTRYPGDWRVTTDTTNTTNILSLSGANEQVHIFLYAYAPGSETYDGTFKRIRDAESNDNTTTRVYDPVLDTKVGGQPAKSIAYRYAQKDRPDLQPGIATIWLVDHGGKRYELRCSNMATHRAEIEAFINSVTFVR